MVEKIDRNNHSFYWKYDGKETGARIIKTWGDGEVLFGQIKYCDGYNEITNSQDETSYYYFNKDNLCTKIIYPDGGVETTSYSTDFEIIETTNADGQTETYSYDEWGNQTSVTRADGSTISYQYDEKSRVVAVTNPEGGSRQWLYNEEGNLAKTIAEDGTETTYTYNEKNLIQSVINAQNQAMRLDYDEQLNLKQATLPDGTSTTWAYDMRGNCQTVTNPLGAVEKYVYDSLDRVKSAKLPDGNLIDLTYDNYDSVRSVKDKYSKVQFEHTILGSIKSREQGGKKVEYEYNTEEQLTKLINEKGDTYQFEYDARGNITKEISFDGLTRTYERSKAGLLQKIKRPNNRWTSYEHNGLGNVLRAEYYDGTWETFAYNQNGQLTQSANTDVEIRFERDKLGRVTKEYQNKHWIESSYNELSQRSKVVSSLGLNMDIVHNEMGQKSAISAAQNNGLNWSAQMKYNELGQEIERLMPGNMESVWKYDIIGRPIHNHVKSGGRSTRRRKYDWSPNNRLYAIKDELTRAKTIYTYDEFSNLIMSESTGSQNLIRAVDDTGNLYETYFKEDRTYGASGQLERRIEGKNDEEVQFKHDMEGNLIEKVEKSTGNTWRYEYYGNNMLKRAILFSTDNSDVVEEISYKYDPLGRRIEKRNSKGTKHFVWDGNTIVHEYATQDASDEQEDLVTWVFDGGFTPLSKITSKDSYSIVSDHLGTPVECYNSDGKLVWSCELDIYGRVKDFTEIKKIGRDDCKEEYGIDFIPFRYQGQYSDLDSGLYYNRFRYFDPELGMYIQQDPIGIEGGMVLYGYVHDPNFWIDPFGLTGIIYLRTDPNTGKQYVGKSKSPETYARRQSAHNRKLKNGNYDFEILQDEIKGKTNLSKAEEDWIRDKGGIAKDGGPLENKIHAMSDKNYKAAGGTKPKVGGNKSKIKCK